MQSKPIEKHITEIPQPKPQRYYPGETIERTTVPGLCSTYKQINKYGSDSCIDVDHGDLFSDFIYLEIDKLESLGRMLCESNEDTCFGYVLLDQLHAFKDRVHQAAVHIDRAVGEIRITQTNLFERKYHVNAVIDAWLADPHPRADRKKSGGGDADAV